jgi:hypothetical protein
MVSVGVVFLDSNLITFVYDGGVPGTALQHLVSVLSGVMSVERFKSLASLI